MGRGTRGEPAPAGGSWWFREATAGDGPLTSLTGGNRADVCIVGGGYTGLWTALRVKALEPATDVVVLDADLCGSGASGRNGGFALTYWHHFLGLQRICGTEEALRLADASEDAVREIGEFCRVHGIDAGYRRNGWLWAATNERQRGAWVRTIEAVAAAGRRPFEALPAGRAAELAGSQAHRDAVFEATAATIQPAALVWGLRRRRLHRSLRASTHAGGFPAS